MPSVLKRQLDRYISVNMNSISVIVENKTIELIFVIRKLRVVFTRRRESNFENPWLAK